MDDAYLARVRDEFGLALPAQCVAFMRAFPSELRTTKLDLSWCQEPISERYFLESSDQVFELNQRVRTPGVPWLEDDGPWPNRFFVIGDDQCGNYYAIDTDAENAAVYFYDHETGRIDQEADGLRAYADKRIQETLDFNEKHAKHRAL